MSNDLLDLSFDKVYLNERRRDLFRFYYPFDLVTLSFLR